MPSRNLLSTALLSLTLAACSSAGDIRETLGLNRKAPDEFRVYARPPLTVPPEFSLRAPGTASDAPTTTPADIQARSTVIGDATSAPTAGRGDTAVPVVSSGELPSGGDAQFLQNAGVQRNTPDVRRLIKKEGEEGLATKNSSYLINPSASEEPVVDATKEAERIKQNKEQNKTAAEGGETPVVESKSKGILGTLGDLF